MSCLPLLAIGVTQLSITWMHAGGQPLLGGDSREELRQRGALGVAQARADRFLVLAPICSINRKTSLPRLVR